MNPEVAISVLIVLAAFTAFVLTYYVSEVLDDE